MTNMANASSIMNLAVLGSGQMGSGIAQVAAQSGKKVFLYDNKSEALQKSKNGILKSLEKLESKKLITEKATDVLARITFTDKIQDLKTAQVVIEAVTENFEVKTSLFKQLDELLASDAILASNTSSIPITRLAAVTKRADKVIGMHFMNPVPLMKLVEMIPGEKTSNATTETIRSLSQEMGKTVVQSRDRPGFIVNRILMPMINEACLALEENLATASDIDIAMKLGTSQPMGPLALADYIGLDTCLFIMGVMYEGLGEEKYKPSSLLKKYVAEAKLGKKSGQGFYKYESL